MRKDKLQTEIQHLQKVYLLKKNICKELLKFNKKNEQHNEKMDKRSELTPYRRTQMACKHMKEKMFNIIYH